MSQPRVIIYRYSSSPFARKIENLLALRNISYTNVNVPLAPPRDALLALGIAYRRIPVLAIDGDIYFNTPLIAQALERAFPPSEKHPTVFPGNDAMLQLVWSSAFADKELFSLAASGLPWSQFPINLLRTMNGGPKPTPELIKKMEAAWPFTRSALTTHLDQFERHLQDGRKWLFSTETPSYADISAHMTLAWARSLNSIKEVFDKKAFPQTIAWLDRLSALIAEKQKAIQIVTAKGDEAANHILAAPTLPLEPFDDVEAGRLYVQRDTAVSVTPDDSGKVATNGTLLTLTRSEIVLQTSPPSGQGKINLHFPRSGFVVRAQKAQSKL
ncbi:hypothetical protein BKA62DRAFT_713404 [Auriculariales sp. MPI-PUGE-AT-0066]|nr:hypothetical protein BKA62DRAFT_713404 [Auriculariales sp. MPI-PUGE-AT-0066]